ncbi:MAG: hypothetical protein L3K03_05560 [Thermoplasmata archaeon]|nr:hypothetical protein [Thermoplasmata archaeon]
MPSGPLSVVRTSHLGRVITARRAILTLAILTPGIPEFLTGSTALAPIVFNPLGFVLSVVFDVALYTTGALLIREYVIRYHKGWASVLLLGAAYGIVEEGLAVHTWFQTGGPPVFALGSYGHFLGINWIWATGLTTFHSLYSIALPLLLLDLIYPEIQGKPILTGRRQIGWVAAFYVIDVAVFAALAPSRPDLLGWVVCVTGVATLTYLAMTVSPSALGIRPGRPTASNNAFFLVGTSWMIVYLLFVLGAPGLHIPPVVAIAAFLAFLLLPWYYLRAHLGSEKNERAIFSLAAGLLAALIGFAVLVILGGDIAVGVPVALGIAFLLLFGREVDRREAARPPAGAMAHPPPGRRAPGAAEAIPI